MQARSGISLHIVQYQTTSCRERKCPVIFPEAGRRKRKKLARVILELVGQCEAWKNKYDV